MADKCYGCMTKYKFREKSTQCPGCRKHFCNRCLDPKKVKESAQTCAYCTHKQSKVNKAEETQILENFHERYYKHRNQGPPIVTRLQFNPKLSQITSGHTTGQQQPLPPGGLTQEDKELEQRFYKLREGRTTQAPSLAELQEQFDKFQGKDETQGSRDTANSSSGQPTSETKSEFEQTQNLIQQMKEEAELESKLESQGKQIDTDLAARFDALKGKESSSNTTAIDQSVVSSDTLVSNQGNEKDLDPQRLLQDLQGMAAQEEQSALQELQSADIQTIVTNFKPTPSTDGNTSSTSTVPPDITYPKFLEDVTPAKPRPQVSEEELQRVIAQARHENEQEAKAKAREDEFYLLASKKVSSLMADSDSDDEVKSKPAKSQHRGGGGGGGEGGGLNFNWDHFDTSNNNMSDDTNKWDFDDDEEFDQQVQMLIEEMSAEVKLEERLEAKGMGHMLEEQETTKPPPPHSLPGPSAAVSTFSSKRPDDDELPWCCMCNSNATVRCFDCDDDLYCVPCFSQCHERFELYNHRYAPYEPSYKPY